jgi:hypothetical protein
LIIWGIEEFQFEQERMHGLEELDYVEERVGEHEEVDELKVIGNVKERDLCLPVR